MQNRTPGPPQARGSRECLSLELKSKTSREVFDYALDYALAHPLAQLIIKRY